MLRYRITVFAGLIALNIAAAGKLGQFLAVYGKNFLLNAGYMGATLIFISFGYSLRKRIFNSMGSIKTWLIFHEYTALTGSALILVHVNNRFNSSVPLIALIMMGTLTISGLIGRHFYNEIRGRLKTSSGNNFIEDKFFPVILQGLKNWRKLHIQLTAIFLTFTLMHIVLVAYYGGLSL